MSFILPTLKGADRDRYHKAVHGLREGSLTITITRQTDSEVRALVQNGDGRQYGVTVNSSLVTCSCYDALFRGVICKHAIAVCIWYLQPHTEEDNRIHLMWDNGTVLCGEAQPTRFWQRWTYNALNWSDLVCQACVQVWRHPDPQLSKDEFFFSSAKEEEHREMS